MSNFEKTLNDNDLYAVWAAMCAMTQDIHAPQDTMTDEQTEAADVLWTRLDAEINLRSERSKAIASGGLVPLTHVGRGSIWEWRHRACTRTGCTWPVPEGVAECSFSAGGPMWAPSDERVSIIAHGISRFACDWVLSAKDDDANPHLDNDRVRRRCAHLMAGGTIESYVEGT